jgi:hypothetical protein
MEAIQVVPAFEPGEFPAFIETEYCPDKYCITCVR